MRLGFVAIVIGAVFLLKNIGFLTPVGFSLLWPILLMLIGIAMVGRHHGNCNCRSCSQLKKGWNVCSCDCDSCADCKKAGRSSKK